MVGRFERNIEKGQILVYTPRHSRWPPTNRFPRLFPCRSGHLVMILDRRQLGENWATLILHVKGHHLGLHIIWWIPFCSDRQNQTKKRSAWRPVCRLRRSSVAGCLRLAVHPSLAAFRKCVIPICSILVEGTCFFMLLIDWWLANNNDPISFGSFFFFLLFVHYFWLSLLWVFFFNFFFFC